MATKRRGKDAGKKISPPGPTDGKKSDGTKTKGEVRASLVKQETTEGQKPIQSDSKKDAGNAKFNIKEANANKPKGKIQESEEGELSNSIAQFLQFLKEVSVEYRKITWPDRSLVLRETWGVLVLVAVITCLVLGFDWAVGHVVFQPLEHWARLLGGGIGHM